MGRHLARFSAVFLLFYVACLPAQVAAQVVRAKPLNYVEFTTAGAVPDQPLPLIIALHTTRIRPKTFRECGGHSQGPPVLLFFKRQE